MIDRIRHGDERFARDLLAILALAHRELDRQGVPPARPPTVDGRESEGDE